jgi:hypothetical protein
VNAISNSLKVKAMTQHDPKKEAKELFSKMYQSPFVKQADAKRCALIAIDKAIEALIAQEQFDPKVYNNLLKEKEEIEKL